MYEYNVIIISVYDGDTVTADIDLGFGVWLRKQKFRLIGIDTPEIRTRDLDEKKRGYEARDRLREIVLNKSIVVKSYGKGKYGRWLVDILDKSGESINQKLITEGHALPYSV